MAFGRCPLPVSGTKAINPGGLGGGAPDSICFSSVLKVWLTLSGSVELASIRTRGDREGYETRVLQPDDGLAQDQNRKRSHPTRRARRSVGADLGFRASWA